MQSLQCRRCTSRLELSTIYFCKDQSFCSDCWSRSWENPKNVVRFLMSDEGTGSSNSSASVKIPGTSSISIRNSARSLAASVESADSIARASLSDTLSDWGDLEALDDDHDADGDDLPQIFFMDSLGDRGAKAAEPAKFAPTAGSPASVMKTSSIIDRTASPPVSNLLKRANSF